jgi:hydroxymethylpyrimidine pyrophosphatase-like HAD family hydrolase
VADLDPEADGALEAFVRESAFAVRGGIVTDLDGTAVLEREGRVLVAPEVEFGLKRLADLGRPVVLNTLRFPLNVVRTFGRAWAAITDRPLPLISLNGAVSGMLVEAQGGAVVFEELDAAPLPASAIEEVLEGVRGLADGGIEELLLFHYPRDWTAGEIIWTPAEARADAARAKYRSASEVFAAPVAELRARLLEREVCMVFLLVEAPQDRLMAYQHARPSSFVTRTGVDKLAGARRLAERLGFDLAASVGCGDTPMDSFLAGCGLALHVGPMALEHKGLAGTVRLADPPALGAALDRLAGLLGGRPRGA